ncbi:MAG TPA: GNAT family N-acetyltransferase [Acidimicrobiales bacterium]|nr:GNAT family N-acetyltransferase [Acidimicrobiales bacterium]
MATTPSGSPSGWLSTSRATTVSELAPAGWDDLVIGHDGRMPSHQLYNSVTWLRRYELSGAFDPVYLLAEAGGEVVGGLATHRVGGHETTSQIRVEDLVPTATPPGAIPVTPCRVIGGLIDGRSGVLTRPGMALHRRAAVLDRLVADAEDVAAAGGECAVLCRTVDAGDLVLRRVLARRGYALVPGPAHLVLTVAPGGLEGYIASFPPRYRNMIRREQRKLRDAGIAITVEPLTRELIPAVLPLVAQLSDKHHLGVAAEAVRGELELTRRAWKERAHAVVARAGDRPVGFLEVVEYRGNAWAQQAGFDYEHNGSLPVYFGVLFYGLMDFAAAAGFTRIDYRYSTDAPKTSRGCAALATVRAVRLLDPATHHRLVAALAPTG